ncbi:hypothetical protein BDV96DRAFT_586688 [Lophiotrema nucula]|uniref:Uncharacterized protein n=1 Tax=Lophiotrema nucula TaxID=690887 RepID=A0A6A5YNG1_9PLEO|nr:hypothetical protein BDV96DRAFT_586688 [Lophiotrema nucula]
MGVPYTQVAQAHTPIRTPKIPRTASQQLPHPNCFEHLDEPTALRAALTPLKPVRQPGRSPSSQSDESYLIPTLPAPYRSTSTSPSSKLSSPASAVTHSNNVAPYRLIRGVTSPTRYYARSTSAGSSRASSKTVSPISERLEYDSPFFIDSVRESHAR